MNPLEKLLTEKKIWHNKKEHAICYCLSKKTHNIKRQANADHKQQLASSWVFTIFWFWSFFGGFLSLYRIYSLLLFMIFNSFNTLLYLLLHFALFPNFRYTCILLNQQQKKIKTPLFSFSSSHFSTLCVSFIWIYGHSFYRLFAPEFIVHVVDSICIQDICYTMVYGAIDRICFIHVQCFSDLGFSPMTKKEAII